MSEISIKTVCCTCLSTDRKLYQLCRILDGINILYMLLTLDPEAYKQGFYKATVDLLVCWECSATIIRIKKFQTQACNIQKHLTSIADGHNDVKLKSFSRLACHSAFHVEYQTGDLAENFIDCGPAKEIKTESDSDDIPLSTLYESDYECDNDEIPLHKKYRNNTAKLHKNNLKCDNNTTALLKNDMKCEDYTAVVVKNDLKCGDNTAAIIKNDLKLGDIATLVKNDLKCGNITEELVNHDLKCAVITSELVNNGLKPGNDAIANEELVQKIISIEKSKDVDLWTNSTVSSEIFKKSISVNSTYLIEKPSSIEQNNKTTFKKKTKIKYIKYFSKRIMDEEEMQISIEKRRSDIETSDFKCDTCLLQFKSQIRLNSHVQELHELRVNCTQCDICHTYREDLNTHKQTHYEMYNCVLCTHTAYSHIDIVRHLRKTHREMCCGKKRSRLKKGQLLEINQYPCAECELTFPNKDTRWKHVQKKHRDGYKCNMCDKKFAFKNNLERHERIHQSPLPREECPICHKMIRTDLIKAHSRIHAHRQSFTCVECDKSFVCRTTYESHLKNAQAHATGDLCRHKCPTCQKGYRSHGELRDHINYQHKGQAAHKCPICGKGLATKRCIRRHVRRAHEGIKECAKDKICQQCGKAFRDKKGLIEHERVHSGARPLTCVTCGRAFRQRAALYAHTKRLHRDTSST